MTEATTTTGRPNGAHVRVQPVLLQDAERVWGMKEDGCKEQDHFDIAPQVSFYRGDNLVLSVYCGKGRDGALAVMRLGTKPTKADAAIIHMDAHTTESPINPVTGKPWGPGEMQGLCDNEGACSTGLLTDVVVSQAIYGDGHIEMLLRKYRGHEVAGGLVWSDAEHMVEGGTLLAGGLVADTMREAMRDDTFDKHFADAASGMPEDLRTWFGITAAVKCMIGLGVIHGAVFGTQSEETRVFTQEWMSPEAVQEWLSGPMGFMLQLLAMK